MLAQLDGKALIRWAIEPAQQADLPVYVVTGGADLTGWLDDVIEVSNDDWRSGLAASLRSGVLAASEHGHDAVVVGLADQPALSVEAWRSVASATTTPIAVATYDGKRGHPVRIGAEVWDALPRAGDEGARLLMRDRPELVTEVPCRSGNSRDIDTAEDLDQFNSPTHSA